MSGRKLACRPLWSRVIYSGEGSRTFLAREWIMHDLSQALLAEPRDISHRILTLVGL